MLGKTRSYAQGPQNVLQKKIQLTVENIITFLLTLVSVNADRLPSVPVDSSRDIIDLSLSLDEYDGFVFRLVRYLFEQFHELALLLVLLAHVDDL